MKYMNKTTQYTVPSVRVSGALTWCRNGCAARRSQLCGLYPLHCVGILGAPDCGEQHKELFFVFFLKTVSLISQQPEVSHPKCVCVGCLLKQKIGAQSSVGGSPPPIESPAEEGIRFTLHNAPLDFTAQPRPNQCLVLNLCQNSNNVDTFSLRCRP